MNPNMADLPRCELFGLRLDPLTMGQAVARCTDAIEHREQLSIGVVNAAKIVSMRRDAQLRDAVARCGMVLADGQAVVWASGVLRAPLPERVAGVDLFMELLAESARRGYRRVSLETGSQDFFRPARTLYAKYGFVECGPFGDYVLDPNSVFMTLELQG